MGTVLGIRKERFQQGLFPMVLGSIGTNMGIWIAADERGAEEEEEGEEEEQEEVQEAVSCRGRCLVRRG